jgi:hypothetical protein
LQSVAHEEFCSYSCGTHIAALFNEDGPAIARRAVMFETSTLSGVGCPDTVTHAKLS